VDFDLVYFDAQPAFRFNILSDACINGALKEWNFIGSKQLTSMFMMAIKFHTILRRDCAINSQLISPNVDIGRPFPEQHYFLIVHFISSNPPYHEDVARLWEA
jgi:hypothetical protein